MKKRGLFLILSLFAVFAIQAQSNFTWVRNKEGKMIAMPKYAVFKLEMPKSLINSYTPSGRQLIDAQLRKFVPNYISPSLPERPMDMQVHSSAYRPFFNVYAPMLQQISPMALDFSETSVIPISERLTFTATGQQYTWPGAGGLTRLMPQLVWNKDRLTIAGGAFGGRFFTPFNLSSQFMGGFNIMTNYELTDKVDIKGWGQYAFYSANEQHNPHMLMNPFFNHTNVGGAVEFKANDGFKFGVGINFERAYQGGGLQPQYMLYGKKWAF